MPEIVKKGTIIYLHSGGIWYQYDERSAPLGAGAMGTVYIGRECNGGMRVALVVCVATY